MATWRLPIELVAWIGQLSTPLHGRLAWRLLPMITGMLNPRRTIPKYWGAKSAVKLRGKGAG